MAAALVVLVLDAVAEETSAEASSLSGGCHHQFAKFSEVKLYAEKRREVV